MCVRVAAVSIIISHHPLSVRARMVCRRGRQQVRKRAPARWLALATWVAGRRPRVRGTQPPLYRHHSGSMPACHHAAWCGYRARSVTGAIDHVPLDGSPRTHLCIPVDAALVAALDGMGTSCQAETVRAMSGGNHRHKGRISKVEYGFTSVPNLHHQTMTCTRCDPEWTNSPNRGSAAPGPHRHAVGLYVKSVIRGDRPRRVEPIAAARDRTRPGRHRSR